MLSLMKNSTFSNKLKMCSGNEPVDYRRLFLITSITLTLFGCFVCAFSIGLVQWQVVEMRDFSSIHEHGIFWDCISAETAPLTIVRNAHLRDADEGEYTSRWRRKCVYKFDDSAVRLLHQAIEAGDAAAREYLLHRFLPQHKAVVFFTVFTFIFAAMSIIIGSCSTCFIPNGILHVVAVGITLSCSAFADAIFFLASMRIDNRYVHGVVDVYQQKVGYAFYVHLLASIVFFFAVLAAIMSAYFLLREDFLLNGCCSSKTESPRYRLSHIVEDYPQITRSLDLDQNPSHPQIEQPQFQPQPRHRPKPNGRVATVIMEAPEETEARMMETKLDSSRWGRRDSYDRSIPFVVQT